MTLPYLAERLRQQVWLVPAVAAVIAAGAALLSALVEERADLAPWGGSLDAVSARAILGAISSAMISFTALVFSVTMLVLQLVSSQLSPRVMRTFLRDRFNQSVLGLFVATFVFSLLTLVLVRDGSVSGLGVIGSIGLVLVAVLAFVAYIDHMANAIRASSVIRAIGDETRATIQRLYPEDGPDDEAETGQLTGGRVLRSSAPSGYVVVIDEEALLKTAARHDLVIHLLVGVGDHITEGGRLASVHGEATEATEATSQALSEAVTVGAERTMSEDPTFGFRQLVDIALRALSPGINDPTTAIQVIDQLNDLLRQLLPRPIEAPRRLRVEGQARVVLPRPDWEAFVRLSVAEILESGRGNTQVRERLRSMLEDLASDGRPARLPALRRALVSLDEPAQG